jgi:tRNA 2-selenouridine synthase
MSIVIDVDDIFDSRQLPIVDVRSPGEYSRGHIPGAVNVPLLDNAERARVGTTYKNQGPQQAIAEGKGIVADKLDRLVESVKTIVSGPDLVLHCWRGGMRSEGFSLLLEQSGLKPRRLQGGYKAFRTAAHQCFAENRRIIILDGHTGAGKTRLLATLRAAGEQVIDLEHLASHRGSAFGGIGQPPQPSVEQFENHLFLQWRDLDPDKPVWIEGESLSIGSVSIPQQVWNQMLSAPSICIEVDRAQRVEFLVKEYGDLPSDELALAMGRIKKRLGLARLQTALHAIERHDMHTVAELALDYYDKAYSKGLLKRPAELVTYVPLASPGQADSVAMLCQLANEKTKATHARPIPVARRHAES